jgi:hypothetical protein
VTAYQRFAGMLTSWSGLTGVACAGIMTRHAMRAHLVFAGALMSKQMTPDSAAGDQRQIVAWLSADRPPSRLPGWAGMRTENAAHRIAVEWDGTGGRQSGVYIPRRDSDSMATVLAGGRLFPGEHHHASFDVRETARDLHVAFASTDRTARVSIDVRVTRRLQGSALFAGLQDASEFFRHGSAGFSATRDGDRLDGLELRTGRWVVEPAEVLAVSSSFFGDARLFPAGSATLDCALLMRDIPATWTAMSRNREPDFEEFCPV